MKTTLSTVILTFGVGIMFGALIITTLMGCHAGWFAKVPNDIRDYIISTTIIGGAITLIGCMVLLIFKK
jgi:hypothetical protein